MEKEKRLDSGGEWKDTDMNVLYKKIKQEWFYSGKVTGLLSFPNGQLNYTWSKNHHTAHTCI